MSASVHCIMRDFVKLWKNIEKFKIDQIVKSYFLFSQILGNHRENLSSRDYKDTSKRNSLNIRFYDVMFVFNRQSNSCSRFVAAVQFFSLFKE